MSWFLSEIVNEHPAGIQGPVHIGKLLSVQSAWVLHRSLLGGGVIMTATSAEVGPNVKKMSSGEYLRPGSPSIACYAISSEVESAARLEIFRISFSGTQGSTGGSTVGLL